MKTSIKYKQKGRVSMEPKRQGPIAVIDSGVGGISVLNELLRLMPNEKYIYFADSKNAPYGTKSRAEVLAIMLENTDTLLSLGAKAIVVACNTATSAAVRVMREKYPSVPIVGIEPAIKPAALVCENPTVVVMATPLTLKEEKFRVLSERFSEKAEIIPLPCPGLMEIIEDGHTDGEIVDTYLNKAFAALDGKVPDAVVLGCTHYPFVKLAVQKYFGEKTRIFDGGEGTAREAKRRIFEAGLETTHPASGHQIEFISTSGDNRVTTLCRKLLELESN